jgi:hypothetical protein
LAKANLNTILSLCNLVFWGLAIWAAASVGLSLWSGGRDLPGSASLGPSPPAAAGPADGGGTSAKTFNRVVAGDIFRTVKPAALPGAPDEVDFKETRLNLTLRGTVIGENVSSYAMIFDGQTRKEEIYRTFEYVQGTRIEEIRKDGVVLQGKNGRELLSLALPEAPPERPDRVLKPSRATTRRAVPQVSGRRNPPVPPGMPLRRPLPPPPRQAQERETGQPEAD